VVGGGLLRVGGHENGAGFGEDVEAEVSAAFDQSDVSFGEDGADEADQGVTVREDPDDVGAAADFPVQTLGCSTRSGARSLSGTR
jgi:hypothetical protein